MNGGDGQSQQVSVAERQQQLQDALDAFDEPTKLHAFLDALTEVMAKTYSKIRYKAIIVIDIGNSKE